MNIEIAAEEIFKIGHYMVTNSILMSWLVVLAITIYARSLSKKISLVPVGTQNAVEMGMETWLTNLTGVFGSEKKAIKYFPFLTTLFVFILFSNWTGLIPGIGSFGFKHTVEGAEHIIPFLRAPSSDLNFTLALALLTVITINVMGVRAQGIKLSISRYINFSSPMNFFVGFLELIGEFTKIISLSFRLFGNIFAGEVLLIIIGYLTPYVIPLPFIGLEIFAGFIQALVFSTLTTVFLSILVESPHH